MASGRLGVAAPVGNTNTTIYTVPVGKVATFNFSIANTSTAAISVRVAVASSGTPITSEWVEYDTVIQPNDVLERTALVASANEQLVVIASATGLAVRAHGFEQ